MARKSADKLNLTPLDRAWARYMEAEARQTEAEVEADKMLRPDGNLKKGYELEHYKEANGKVLRTMNAKFRSFDAWNALRKWEADLSNSNVPESDAKSLIAEAMAESGSELQWSTNVGLVAHKLTQAVYGFTVREESQEVPPLCPACA